MLLRATKAITVKGDNDDQDAGINIIRKALQSPDPAKSRKTPALKARSSSAR